MKPAKLILASFTLATLLSSTTRADSLGIANDYNVFTIGNLTKSNVDVQGKVAVGGNAVINNYTTSSNLGSSTTNFIVNGNLTKTGGGTQNGTVLVKGNASFDNPTITGKLQVDGNTYINPNSGGSVSGGVVHASTGTYTAPSWFPTSTTGYTALPFSFSDAANYLTSHSTFWGGLTANGTTANPYNGVKLTGTNPSLDIFTLNASTLGSATSLTINAPAGATVLVNVLGTSVNVPSMGITLSGGIDKQHVLYNFPTATTVNFNSIAVLGSVLAPYADVCFNYGNIDGTLAVKNLTGTGEEHNFRFLGNLTSPPTSVPLPTSAYSGALLLTGLITYRKLRPQT